MLPVIGDQIQSVWHLFVVRCKDRDGLIKHLAENKIEASIHYPIPPHKQGAYKEMEDLSLPISEAIHSDVLSLPMGPHMTEEDAQRVVEMVKEFF